ncbi:MAG: ABC transporter permease [Albidovulum sp.]|nr:ABC transporter permease [Albidovulum sp.]MDE0307725.1 ABC transporter permease [Albidovulum sp.]MDE0532101.1 ABC transporter permease [Albidovulum sp.]
MRDDLARAKRIGMEYGFYLLLLAIILVFTVISNSFLTISNWAQIAIASTFLLAAAAGLTLVLINGEIDLSIGSIAYVAATVVYLTADVPAGVSVLAALVAGLAIGLFNGWLVAYLGMNSLLVTLGLMIAYRGVALVFTEGTVKQAGDGVAALGQLKLFGIVPVIFLVALAFLFIFQWVLRETKLGTFWLAIGNNEDSARKIGIPVRRAKLAAYALCGISAAASGTLLAAYLGEITTFTGRGMEFQAVAAVVIGGTSLFGGRGNVFPGTICGVLLLIVINNGLGTRGVSPFVYPFVAGALIFIAIYLDSIKNRARQA